MDAESQTPLRTTSSSQVPAQVPPFPGDVRSPAPDRTTTDPEGHGVHVWLGHDPVFQLRECASGTIHALPASVVDDWTIGSDPSAALCLVDPSGLVSRRHARLVHDGFWWKIEDLHSKNGLRQDRDRSSQFSILPGMQIGIGSLTLTAENAALVGLRAYLARVLGWDATGRPAVELAIQAIRSAADQRRPLVMVGADDLVAVARQIHLRTSSSGAPFIVCGTRSREADSGVRVTATHADPVAAIELASGGTVCVRAEQLPRAFDRMVEATHERRGRARTQLVICANHAPVWANFNRLILVPPLQERSASDLPLVVAQYATDAIRELDASPTSFSDVDREWVVRNATASFADIEIAAMRIVARNDSGNAYRAAARLRISHVALGKWLKRRGLAS